MRPRSKLRSSRGAASIIAILLLAIFAAIAVSYSAQTGLNMRQAGNAGHAQAAQLEAEGGLAYVTQLMDEISPPRGLEGQVLLDALAAAVQTRLNGTANLSGQTVSYDGSTITIPPIATDEAGSFTVALSLDSDGTVRASVTGAHSDCTRGVRMDFEIREGNSAVCDYGVASKGKITLSGQAEVIAANDPSEANMFSAAMDGTDTFNLTGQAKVQGDVFVVNPNGTVTLTGQATVAGYSGGDPELLDHAHIGVSDIEFPEADPGLFEPYATNVINSSTRLKANQTYTNIRIAANTNPTFSNRTTLKGVIYVEAPNKVKFAGQVTVYGVIVTEDAGEDATDANQIDFSGQSDIHGVEELPDTPEFSGLKEMPGTFLLAPGFGVKFSGQFGTIGGSMGADAFDFSGQANGYIKGWIINWGNSEFNMSGQANITLDNQGLEEMPFGFSVPCRVSPLPRTYEEF